MNSKNVFPFLIFSCILFLLTCKKGKNEFAPVANFSTLKIEFGKVTFSNKSINATEYLWDFGDGNTSMEKDPIHDYKELGVYNVKLTAIDGTESDIFVQVVAIGQIFPENLTRLSNLPFGERAEMMNFTLNDKAYVGCGIKFSPFEYPTDLWEFDPSTKSWTNIINNLNFSQASGVSFVINNIAYGGLGNSNNTSDNYSFYSFDPSNLSFNFDSNIPFSSLNSYDYVTDGLGFSYNEKGYLIGDSQFTISEKKIWEYNPNNSEWIEKGTHPMDAVAGMFHFQLDEKVIIGMGNSLTNSNFSCSNDIWEYNVINGTWTQKSDFPGKGRRDGISFIHNGNGYFGFGTNFESGTGTVEVFSDLWKYDASNDSWEKIADMPVDSKSELFGFVLGNSLFFGSGYNSANQITNSFYEYEL